MKKQIDLSTRREPRGMLARMTSSPFARVMTAGSLMVGGLTLALASPASAAICTSGVEGDVNGDGYAEVAVSEAGRSYGEGAVHVFYGRASGLSAGASGKALDDQYLDQGSPGVPSAGADYDDFGSAVAFGDYNDDGCADLAVGAQSDGAAGSIFVFYGSKTGLKTTGSTRITNEALLGDPGMPADQGFGANLAQGDLDDDGVDDLAIGVPSSGEARGTVAVLLGGSEGLTATQMTVLDDSDVSEGAFQIGKELVVGDFDGNGVQELAIGMSDSYDADGVTVGGVLQLFEGTASGLEPSQGPLTAEDLGFNDVVQFDDSVDPRHALGEIMAAGDVDADGKDDLAVGMPHKGNGGAVAVVKGSATGLTSAGVKVWDQGVTGVVGTPGEDDSFGAALAMGRLDAGPTDDLAIGLPYDLINGKLGAGSVIILLGSPTGLTTAGNGGARFHQDSSGVAGTAELQDAFGRAVTIANVQSKTQGSLIIGAPREKIGKISATGQFHQLSIAAGGPKTSGSVALNLDSAGVKGASRKEAEFGRALRGSGYLM